MANRGILAATAVIALSASLSGCGFLFTRGPSNVGSPPQSDPDCTESLAMPAVDATIAGLVLAGMVSALAHGESSMDTGMYDSSSKSDVIAPSLVFASMLGGSAVIGYMRVDRCKEARAAYREAYPYGPPPMGYPVQPQPYPYAQPQPYPQPQPYVQPQPYPQPQPIPQSQ